ncbi:Cyclic nucleotide-gated cation beta-1 isoform X1 [Oopsacas minuta]|uniref:Cyclic nucleotide-gated cation beta-1 isoform X1 n=1 Tax=Oopsacas minuta TaxID=111878 RepID=A0AAV7JXQ4_9METZ|nr:Cyclic nucleotide-gated cation beta-1 isoform X1 [Oopsacas minuta]
MAVVHPIRSHHHLQTLTPQDSFDQTNTTVVNLIIENQDSSNYHNYRLKNTEYTGVKLLLINRFGLYYDGDFKFKTLLSYTIDEYGTTYFIAMFLVTVACLWNAYMIPLRWAFIYGTIIPSGNFSSKIERIPNSDIFYILDLIADTIYIFDIFLIQSHKQYISKGQGVKMRDIKNTVCYYLHSNGFYLDVISIFVPWLPELQYFATKRYHPIFRLTRYLKFHRFHQFLMLIQHRLQYAQMFRQIRVLFQILIITHTLGCVFFLYYVTQGQRTDGIFAGFIAVETQDLHPLIFSFYWGFVIITNIHNQARPSNEGQYIFMIICHFIGSLHMAYVFAVFVSSLRVGNWHRTSFRLKAQRARCVFTLFKGKIEATKIRKTVTDYYEYGQENHVELLENEVLNYFPKKIRTNLAEECYLKILKRVYLFKNLSQSFFLRLLQSFENRIYLPNELVYKKDDIGNELFIITKGKVYLIESGRNIGTLIRGQLFGYHELFPQMPSERFRSCNAKTEGFTHLLVFHKRTIDRILDQFPKDSIAIHKTVLNMDKVFKGERMRAFPKFGMELTVTDRITHKLIKIFRKLHAINNIYIQINTRDESVSSDSETEIYSRKIPNINNKTRPNIITKYVDDCVVNDVTERPAANIFKRQTSAQRQMYLSPNRCLETLRNNVLSPK